MLKIIQIQANWHALPSHVSKPVENALVSITDDLLSWKTESDSQNYACFGADEPITPSIRNVPENAPVHHNPRNYLNSSHRRRKVEDYFDVVFVSLMLIENIQHEAQFFKTMVSRFVSEDQKCVTLRVPSFACRVCVWNWKTNGNWVWRRRKKGVWNVACRSILKCSVGWRGGRRLDGDPIRSWRDLKAIWAMFGIVCLTHRH